MFENDEEFDYSFLFSQSKNKIYQAYSKNYFYFARWKSSHRMGLTNCYDFKDLKNNNLRKSSGYIPKVRFH